MCQRFILASHVDPPRRRAASGADRLYRQNTSVAGFVQIPRGGVGKSIVEGLGLDLNFRYSFGPVASFASQSRSSLCIANIRSESFK
jgi:hypothetical protein